VTVVGKRYRLKASKRVFIVRGPFYTDEKFTYRVQFLDTKEFAVLPLAVFIEDIEPTKEK